MSYINIGETVLGLHNQWGGMTEAERTDSFNRVVDMLILLDAHRAGVMSAMQSLDVEIQSKLLARFCRDPMEESAR